MIKNRRNDEFLFQYGSYIQAALMQPESDLEYFSNTCLITE